MNKIIIDLSQEDRERIDRLTVALEALQPPTVTMDHDPIRKALAEQVAKASKAPTETPTESHENAQESTEAETPATPQPEPETTATEEPVPKVEAKPAPKVEAKPAPKVEAKPAPTPAAIQQKVVELVNAAKEVSTEHAEAVKAKIRAIVNDYAVAVSKIPEDKRAEAMERINALEV